MARMIIACATLKQELNMLMEKHRCDDPVLWLEAGDHNRPQKRREAIEAALETCSQYDTIVLAMTFCGNILTGLNSREHTLLLPCFDDCIGLLLDSPRQPDTYYLTDGWLTGQQNILAEYEMALAKYGPQKTRKIFSAMFRGYRALAWVDTGCTSPEDKNRARDAAAVLGLDFIVVPGTLSRLERLLFGDNAPFVLRIPPHTTISAEMRRGMIPVTVGNERTTLYALPGENLLALLRRNGLAPNAPCGGQGTCGKCSVLIDGESVPSCQISVQSPMEITIPHIDCLEILAPEKTAPTATGPLAAAVDIGTTSVVCTLVDDTGEILAVKAVPNPQGPFGADVVSRIRAALSGEMEHMTRLIRNCVNGLLSDCCEEAGIPPEKVRTVCIVGNPAMQQLFLQICPRNLVEIPFSPVLTRSYTCLCGDVLPSCPQAQLLTVPDISGYVGADTVGCILAESLHLKNEPTLLVDIGTNGEMVLCAGGRMISCATAAGPALEGANITCGMTASPGAIDHVWLTNVKIQVSTIGNMPPIGICGSGLIDYVAVLLEMGMINERGRLLSSTEQGGQRVVHLTDSVFLTQEDIRQVQLAKGSIRAGIELMARTMGIEVTDISQCLLAGAFGTYLNPESSCRIGLLPPELASRIRSVGNGALTGARQIAVTPELLLTADQIVQDTQYLELASLPEFPKTFAKAMRF